MNRTVGAKNKSTLAGMVEELNLTCMDVYTQKASNGMINVGITMDEVYNNLTAEMKNNIETVGGTSSINLVNSTQSSVTLLNDAEAIGSTGTAGQNTATIEVSEEKNSTSYYLKANGMYYPMSIRNLKVELDEENASSEQPIGAGSLGSGIEITFIDNGETEEKNESDYITVNKNGTTITLTAKAEADGSTQVVVRDGSVTLTGNIDVTVNPTYTICLGTMTNGNVGITTNSIDTTSNTKYGSEVEITLTATGATGYILDKWNDEETTNPRTISVTTTGIYYAIFKEKPKPYGAQVQLNSGNPIAVKGNNTIDDNWKLFYVDDDDNDDSTEEYVHLIYGDYYPANVQTEITSENTIFVPAHKYNLTTKEYEDSNYVYSVNSKRDRLALLQYLKNNVDYAESNLDTSIPIGSYESWTNLETMLTGTGKVLEEKTIRVQGAPNITMWKKSWNEQGYTELVLKDDENQATGYYIGKKVSSGTQDYNSTVNLKDDIGYSDKLYFPYKNNSATNGNAAKAYSYWMASPGGNRYNLMCLVGCNGIVGCGGYFGRKL